MPFKEHPHYDESDAEDWLYLRPEDWTELEPGPFRDLHDTLKSQKETICKIALDRILIHAGPQYLAETPHASESDFLFHPIDDHGFRVFVSYTFQSDPDRPSGDSDSWWAIVHCTYAVEPFPAGRRKYYVTDLGWTAE